MKPKITRIIDECLNNGISIGYQRAHKHDNLPSDSFIKTCIHDAINEQLYEYFSFENDLSCHQLAGLSNEELMKLISRREIGESEITGDQLGFFSDNQESLGIERISHDRDLNGNIISLHGFWRKVPNN